MAEKRALEQPTKSATRSEAQVALAEALRTEYGVLATMLSTVWYASLFRVSLLLGVVSAVGVALGFAAQADSGIGGRFGTFALIALPLALLLGITTFVRTVELQREAWLYITGMNRIRHATVDSIPAIAPYLVLPIYDDASGMYRSQGTGVRMRPPRPRFMFALAQTQGIVAVVTAALAAATGGIATAAFDQQLQWAIAAVVFVAVLGTLLMYWSRSFSDLHKAIRPMFRTPPAAVDAPI